MTRKRFDDLISKLLVAHEVRVTTRDPDMVRVTDTLISNTMDLIWKEFQELE